jgi:hypothetical protein
MRHESDVETLIPARPLHDYMWGVYRAKGLVNVAMHLFALETDEDAGLMDLDVKAATDCLLSQAVALLTRIGDGLGRAQEAEDRPEWFEPDDFEEGHPRRKSK